MKIVTLLANPISQGRWYNRLSGLVSGNGGNAMRWVVAIGLAVCGFASVRADDPEFQRRQILELLAECQKKGHSRMTETQSVMSTRQQPGPDGFLICTATTEFQQLSALGVEYTPRMIEILADALPTSQRAARYYLCQALGKITRAIPKTNSEPVVMTKADLLRLAQDAFPDRGDDWVAWWKRRDKTPERFATAAKKWAETKEKDKGLLSTSRRVLNDKTGKVEETTERTVFAEAHADLLAFGFDAIPEIIERFEKKDYTLKPVLDDLTDHSYNLDESLDWAVSRYIKWWRDPSEHAPAMRVQMPPVSAAKVK